MRTRLITALTWLCLLLQVGVLLGAGRAICVGVDGHMALELSHVGPCHTEAARHHDPGEATAEAACPQHDCTDLALAEPARGTSARTSGDDLFSSVAVTAVSFVLSDHPSRQVARNAGSNSSPSPDALRGRRTIVLLI